MYGPATAATPPPPPHRPGPGAWGMTVRLLFASFPLWSLGLLAWVPSLRFAVLRKRPLDWAVFGLSVVLTIGYVVLLETVPADPSDDGGLASVFAGFYIVAMMIGGTVHAVLADRFPRPPRHAPPPYGYGYGYPPPHVPAVPQQPSTPPPAQPPSSSRMRQVASELDELDELLRKRGDAR